MLTTMLLAALLSAGAGEKTGDRELVVLVLIDAVRANHIGAYGYERPTSPNIDALAKSGVRYSRAYTNAPWTRPSTTSFLTGLNASRHRTETEDSKLPAGVTTLAERLHAAGFVTTGFSANGNGGSLAGLERGFDLFEDPTNTYKRGHRGKAYNGLPDADFLSEQVLSHLERSTAQKEFLFIFFVDPHDPYHAPPKLERMFLGDFKGKIRRRALWEYNNDYPPDERFSMTAIYDAGIRFADQGVGRIVDGIKALGLWGNTTLFVTADHGEGFGEHGFYLHAHHFWEEVTHIPLVAVGPRFKPGADPRLTQPIDVAATIAALAGADRAGLTGHSLLDAPGGDPIISEYNEFGIHRQAIVGQRYKVIWQRPADEAWYLRTAKKKEFFPSVSFDHEVVHAFDLERDPGEKNNLAADMPAEAAELLARLRAFVAESQTLASKGSGR